MADSELIQFVYTSSFCGNLSNKLSRSRFAWVFWGDLKLPAAIMATVIAIIQFYLLIWTTKPKLIETWCFFLSFSHLIKASFCWKVWRNLLKNLQGVEHSLVFIWEHSFYYNSLAFGLVLSVSFVLQVFKHTTKEKDWKVTHWMLIWRNMLGSWCLWHQLSWRLVHVHYKCWWCSKNPNKLGLSPPCFFYTVSMKIW